MNEWIPFIWSPKLKAFETYFLNQFSNNWIHSWWHNKFYWKILHYSRSEFFLSIQFVQLIIQFFRKLTRGKRASFELTQARLTPPTDNPNESFTSDFLRFKIILIAFQKDSEYWENILLKEIVGRQIVNTHLHWPQLLSWFFHLICNKILFIFFSLPSLQNQKFFISKSTMNACHCLQSSMNE